MSEHYEIVFENVAFFRLTNQKKKMFRFVLTCTNTTGHAEITQVQMKSGSCRKRRMYSQSDKENNQNHTIKSMTFGLDTIYA